MLVLMTVRYRLTWRDQRARTGRGQDAAFSWVRRPATDRMHCDSPQFTRRRPRNVSLPIENRAGLVAPLFEELAQKVSRHQSIKHALDWLAAHEPPLTIADMVTQDEFSHDILVNYNGG